MLMRWMIHVHVHIQKSTYDSREQGGWGIGKKRREEEKRSEVWIMDEKGG